MSNRENILFVGLPSSGKTTFLAALWHVLCQRSSSTKLKLKELSGHRTYLNQIAEEWRKCSQVPRTSLQSEQVVVLHLDGEDFGSCDLSIPDLAGEAFEKQLTDRRISYHHDAIVQAATGVMLFLHPDVRKGPQILDACELEKTLTSDQTTVEDSTASSVQKPWSLEELPHQAKLVELLQILIERKQSKLRVAVVVSAWDLVKKEFHPLPHDYISRELPLLQQFLEANDDLLEHAVFGVSAQGGDITKATEKKSLLELDDELERIKVQQDQDIGQDITKPIAWLLGAG